MNTLSFPKLGIELTINRVAFSIGNFNIYWYGILIAVAFVVGLIVYQSKNRSCGFHQDEGLDIILLAMVGAILGARLYYVIFSWNNYKDDILSIFDVRGGGLAIYGGIIGAAIVIFFVSRKKNIPTLAVLDAAFPGCIIGQSIGRWGNFFNMEAFGCNTNLPWGMTSSTIVNYLEERQQALFHEGVKIIPTDPVHPTFFYESFWNLIGFIILFWIIMPKRKYDGEVTYYYLAWYGFGRFIIEGLRTDSLMIGIFRVSQLLGIALFIFGLTMIIIHKIQWNKSLKIQADSASENLPNIFPLFASTEESKERIALLDEKLSKKKVKE